MGEETGAEGSRELARTIWAALGGAEAFVDRLDFTGEGALASAFRVSDLAAASIGAAGLALAELLGAEGPAPRPLVDRRLASFWFAGSVRPLGWTLPPPWDPLAGDYRAADGWIRLHTNAPRHRSAALDVLRTAADRASAASEAARWRADDLEAAIVQAGGCAAAMRSAAAWRATPQGSAVRQEPLVIVERRASSAAMAMTGTPSRPLSGLRILDLTRVLAGPVATRFLAGYGAEVLRIDPPDWDEPGIAPEVTVGKRCARLDLRRPGDLAVFERLLGQADGLIHGYRPGALERLGLGEARRKELAPDLIEVTLDAYGWSGPWAGRRGFDSLVQMSSGLAEAGMRWKGADAPTPLPVQALDHATGYLMAGAFIRALLRRRQGEGGGVSRLSLARTAEALLQAPTIREEVEFAPPGSDDLAREVEPASFGELRRLRPPLSLGAAPMRWAAPATALGAHEPAWGSSEEPPDRLAF